MNTNKDDIKTCDNINLDNKINIISLGCDKNTVDSEVMMGLLIKDGYNFVAFEDEADLIIVNTCCFIKDALEESVNTVLEIVRLKEKYPEKKLLVTGCMAQKYKQEIFKEMPEVDGIIGVNEIDNISEIVKNIFLGEKINRTKDFISVKNVENLPREAQRIKHYAYLKIAEGCDNNCTYCIIPSVRGKYISRSIEDIASEAEYLARQGFTEIILVAQDTAYYGMDIYGERKLYELLKLLCKIEGINWIRLLYCYPENITDELIDVIKNEDKICKYIDMPIQHSSNKILRLMGRKTSNENIRMVVNKLRMKVPEIAIRTTIILGFSGEEKQDFDELKLFLKEIKFDRLGAFAFSREIDTPAYKLPNLVDEDIKEARKNEIMQLQQKISKKICAKKIGKTLNVIVDGYLPEDDVYVARTMQDAPEIDGMVFVKSPYEILSGDNVLVLISDAYEYDLLGDVVNEDESC